MFLTIRHVNVQFLDRIFNKLDKLYNVSIIKDVKSQRHGILV